MYPVPFQPVVPTPKQQLDIQHAATLQNFPINRFPTSSLVPQESRELISQFQHLPSLDNINQQFQATQQIEYRHPFPTITFNPNYFGSAASTPQHFVLPHQLHIQTLPLRSETVHRAHVKPLPVTQVTTHHLRPWGLQHQGNHQNPQNIHIYSPHVKTAPLIYNQVYHPAFVPRTNVIRPQMHQPVQHPKPLQTYHMFVPVRASIKVMDEPKQEEEKEEVNEEEEEEEDHENSEKEPETDLPGYKKQYDFNENFFTNSKYKFPRFHEDGEKEEKESYKVEDDEEDENDRDDHEESMKKFVFAQPFTTFSPKTKKSTSRGPQQFKPNFDQKKPKTEIKMIRYSKSINTPPKEYIESKGSESIPIIHKTHQSIQENWYIKKKY